MIKNKILRIKLSNNKINYRKRNKYGVKKG